MLIISVMSRREECGLPGCKKKTNKIGFLFLQVTYITEKCKLVPVLDKIICKKHKRKVKNRYLLAAIFPIYIYCCSFYNPCKVPQQVFYLHGITACEVLRDFFFSICEYNGSFFHG